MASFREISGNAKAIRHLKRAILTDHVSHAYMICGRGPEKKQLADAFAQALQCETLRRRLPDIASLDDVDACGTCRSCLQSAGGNMPDIISWQHEKPGTFSVSDVRSLTSDIQIRPFENPKKIYIIPDCHLMTAQAQNALLKTLEEPPEYAHLMLLSDTSDAMLETVRSRCVIISLDDSIAQPSEDLVRFALGIILKCGGQDPYTAASAAVLELSSVRDNAPQLLDLFTSWYRDVLYYKAAGEDRRLLYKEYASEIHRYASSMSYKNIKTVLDEIHTARLRLASNVSYEMTMKLLLLAMSENSGKTAESS